MYQHSPHWLPDSTSTRSVRPGPDRVDVALARAGRSSARPARRRVGLAGLVRRGRVST